MSLSEDDEMRCVRLWDALVDMDQISCSPKQKEVLSTLIGYAARDMRQVFKTIGFIEDRS